MNAPQMQRRTFVVGLAATALAATPMSAATAAPAAPAAPVAGGSPFFAEVPLWDSATDPVYENFHVHAAALSTAGTLLAFTEGRYEVCDAGPRDVLLRRSTDGGATWGETQVVVASVDGQSWGNPAVVVDRDTGEIFLFFNLGFRDPGNTTCSADRAEIYLSSSTDDGATWSAPVEMAHLFAGNPYGWTLHGPGPGGGLQLDDGRLFIPSHHRREVFGTTVPERLYGVQCFSSDDHGRTWQAAGPVPVSPDFPANEPRAFQRDDGAVVINARNAVGGSNLRIGAVSTDGGSTFGPPFLDPAIPAYRPTDSGLRRLTGGPGSTEANRLLFSHPAASTRANMTVSLSYDEGATYPVNKVITPGPAFYSDLAVLDDHTIVLLYGRDGTDGSFPQIVSLARFNLEWLTDGADSV